MSDKKISVLSFNILAGVGPGRNYSAPALREKWIVQIVADLNPDLIGFQETNIEGINWEEKLREDLCDKGVYEYRALRQEADFRLPKMSVGSGLIIYWKKDRFTLIDSGCHEYTPFSRQIRYFQWVKLHDKKYDKTIVMTNTHLSIDEDATPREQPFTHEDGITVRNKEAGELFGFWKENVTGDTVLFGTGDYNGTEKESGHATLQQDGLFLPSYRIAAKDDHNSCIDFCYTSPASFAVDEKRTLHYTFRDQIAVQDLDDTYYCASDHDPVMTWGHYR